MFGRLMQLRRASLFVFAVTVSSLTLAGNDSVVTVNSAFPIEETIERLKKDVADKGIEFFDEIDDPGW